MLKAPSTYAEWIKCLEMLKEATMDELVIEIMNQGHLSWQAGITERFTIELFEVLNVRITMINNMLDKKLRGGSGSEFELASTLINGRNAIKTLFKLSKINSFPEDLKKTIEKTLIDYADKLQHSLIESAKADRTGRLVILIKNNPVNKLYEDEIKEKNPDDEKVKTSIRRVIIT